MSTEIEWNLIRKIAWTFTYKTNVEFEELQAEATLAYLKALKTYDPEKGTMSTWVYIHMKNAIINYLKKEQSFSYIEMPDYISDESFNRKIKFENVIDAANSDVKIIYDMVLNRPNYFLSFNSNKAKNIIRTILRENNEWSWPRIWNAIRNIKKCLNEMG